MPTKHEDLPPIRDFGEFHSIGKLVEKHPDKFNENRLRWMLRNRGSNGLEDAVIKLGNEIQIHEPRLLYVLLKQQKKA